MSRLLLLLVSSTLWAQHEMAKHFDYDRTAPLDVNEISVGDRGGVKVRDLTYASPRGGRVPAYLVEPPGKGPFAVVLWGHWMMRGSPFRNRTEFLDEAVLLARSGALSLLIDAPLVRPGWIDDPDPMSPRNSYAAQQQVVDFRRGLDLLLARRDRDPRRVAYVGHSFDAKVGAILAGIEKRIGSFVLMAGVYATEDWVFETDQPVALKVRKEVGDDKVREYFRQYAWDDPVHYIGHSAPAAVFLQFGRKDEPIPEAFAGSMYRRFGDPKRIAFYDAGHALDAAARRDRLQWLVGRLSLRPADPAAIDRIPALR
jgi:hypothetical protein